MPYVDYKNTSAVIHPKRSRRSEEVLKDDPVENRHKTAQRLGSHMKKYAHFAVTQRSRRNEEVLKDDPGSRSPQIYYTAP